MTSSIDDIRQQVTLALAISGCETAGQLRPVLRRGIKQMAKYFNLTNALNTFVRTTAVAGGGVTTFSDVVDMMNMPTLRYLGVVAMRKYPDFEVALREAIRHVLAGTVDATATPIDDAALRADVKGYHSVISNHYQQGDKSYMTDTITNLIDATVLVAKEDGSSYKAAAAKVIAVAKAEKNDEAALHGAADIMDESIKADADVKTKYENVASGNEKGRDIARKVMDGVSGVTSAETTPASVPDATLDPTFEAAVDALLSKATSGSIASVRKLIEGSKAASELAAKLQVDLRVANAKASAARAVPSTGTVTIDAKELTYKVEMKPANDLFKNNVTPVFKNLKFEVPTLVWTDKAGNVVKHPLCPERDMNYLFDEKTLVKTLSSLVLRRNIWLHGHTGSGKSTRPQQIAACLGFPVISVNMDRDIERSDFVGKDVLEAEGGATVSKFKPGILPTALSMPCFFVMDEFDAARPDVMFVMQRVLEGRGLMLTEEGGKIIPQHDLCSIFATANTRGQGDEYGIYAGTRPMNASTLDRFASFIEVPYMSRDQESKMLKARFPGIGDAILKKVCQFAEELRKAFVNGEILMSVSPRVVAGMCEAYEFLCITMDDGKALELAVETAVIDRAAADNRQRVLELRARCF